MELISEAQSHLCTFSHEPVALHPCLPRDRANQSFSGVFTGENSLRFSYSSRLVWLLLRNSSKSIFWHSSSVVPGSALSWLDLMFVFLRPLFSNISFFPFTVGRWKMRRDLSRWECSLCYCEHLVRS